MIIQENEKRTIIYPFENQEALDEKNKTDADWGNRRLASAANIEVNHRTKEIQVNCSFSGSMSAETVEAFISALQKAVEISKGK